MNKLYLRAVRRRAAGAIHLHKTWGGTLHRVRSAAAVAPLHYAAPLHAQWRRNAATGVLECHWVADAPAQPRPRLSSARFTSKFRMQWRPRGAGMRPPSRLCANG
ncbi:hypothetical protein [Dyella acidisoli]|uniref:Uncharacterized protein n=1 Tax=Dyella acidisoli TaxID=1867834 RepID=A0ABQ5XVF0_9GAMM|nr:hypothetical protein [Dyella acidisoli]GLQ94476.1 hypothetical protein GCM10007901_34280 [Dyella acidisoli]